VQQVLADPAYSGFFTKFRPENGTNTTSARCDYTYEPPLCSKHYHDQFLTPQLKGHSNAGSPYGSKTWNDDMRNGYCETKCDCGPVCEKRFLKPFIGLYKTEHFTKTGSGQT
jgi:hypothetical protein